MLRVCSLSTFAMRCLGTKTYHASDAHICIALSSWHQPQAPVYLQVWATLAVDVPVAQQERKRALCSDQLRMCYATHAPLVPCLELSCASVILHQVLLTHKRQSPSASLPLRVLITSHVIVSANGPSACPLVYRGECD